MAFFIGCCFYCLGTCGNIIWTYGFKHYAEPMSWQITTANDESDRDPKFLEVTKCSGTDDTTGIFDSVAGTFTGIFFFCTKLDCF